MHCGLSYLARRSMHFGLPTQSGVRCIAGCLLSRAFDALRAAYPVGRSMHCRLPTQSGVRCTGAVYPVGRSMHCGLPTQSGVRCIAGCLPSRAFDQLRAAYLDSHSAGVRRAATGINRLASHPFIISPGPRTPAWPPLHPRS